MRNLGKQACTLSVLFTAIMPLYSACVNGITGISLISHCVYGGMLLWRHAVSVLQERCSVCAAWGLLLLLSTSLRKPCSSWGSV